MYLFIRLCKYVNERKDQFIYQCTLKLPQALGPYVISQAHSSDGSGSDRDPRWPSVSGSTDPLCHQASLRS